ncbi:MAG: methionine--tRNA ligase, partial [Patescibacteria group bacterium]
MANKFYVTTPIYYVNDKPHLGSAYTTLAADVLARYHRHLGEDVWFLTGTAEHGDKIAGSAAKAGQEVQAFVDEMSAKFSVAWDSLNIEPDDFIRTTEPRHVAAVIKFFNKLKASGQVYKGIYEGLYCTPHEAFLKETDLVDGVCPDHKIAPERVAENNWFFKLSDYAEPLRQLIESNELVIAPAGRRNEVLAFLSRGLEDISISRPRAKFAIPLPWDETQKIYVWMDELFNYCSAIGYGVDDEKFRHYWPADLHLMGKDIIKFHCVIWPALLLAIGERPPKQVFAHGFFTVNGQKMSKTLGNVIDPVELAADYGVDAVRFFLLSEFAFGADGDISVERFKERYNSHLANGLGNVVSRVLTLVEKYRDQVSTPESDTLATATAEVWANYHAAMAELQFDAAIGEIWRLLSLADGYVEAHKPWELAKNNPAKLGTVLATLVEILRQVGWLLYPIMPATA